MWDSINMENNRDLDPSPLTKRPKLNPISRVKLTACLQDSTLDMNEMLLILITHRPVIVTPTDSWESHIHHILNLNLLTPADVMEVLCGIRSAQPPCEHSPFVKTLGKDHIQSMHTYLSNDQNLLYFSSNLSYTFMPLKLYEALAEYSSVLDWLAVEKSLVTMSEGHKAKRSEYDPNMEFQGTTYHTDWESYWHLHAKHIITRPDEGRFYGVLRQHPDRLG